ncbi:MAG: 1-acyl-sn-glycerol-3-phosphate acyltransferase [Actinomycetota bacterium]|nr:1-acyl-sn-glycerol-3-phosphate acyltransferase [Actinomycetota bacterium]
MNEVLDSPEFIATLQKLADESGRPLAEVREEAEADLEEMAVRLGNRSKSVWDRFSRWLSRAYLVDYKRDEVERLRELNESASLIFLPNHRSYLDPMVLRSALIQHGFPPNNVLGGANLAIWPFSEIGQRNGIVFIRREFRDDHVYRATLKAYLSHLMVKRQNLEWYIEGGRTRTGKLRPPRLGILSYVMDAYGEHPERDVLVIPTSIIYDQQHEVGAISAEEMGGTKNPESLKWMYQFASSQSRRLGRAYLRFGEPLSLGDAVALTADDEGNLRPRLAVPKVAIENANRINTATPITPGALITFALLDNGGRSITALEGREILLPLVDYIRRRGLPMTAWPDLNEFGRMREALDRLVGEGVVSVYDGGTEPVYTIAAGKQHEAAFYRNTIIHFFLARSIAELAALQAAEDLAADIPEATWQNARRLKDLLRFEFFFPSTRTFSDQVAAETTIMNPGWQDHTYSPAQVLAEMADQDMLVAHRVIGPFLEAYSVLADELALLGNAPAESTALVQRSIGVAQQRWLQRQLTTPESVSADYFRNAIQLADKLGLMASDDPDLAAQRRAFADELHEITRRLDALRRIAQAAGQPLLAERSPRTQRGSHG